MNEPRTSGVATVMFTDVEASTDITTRLGDDAAAALLSAHDAIIREQTAMYDGRQVRSTGDGFLIVFDSARAAVSCALSIQRALAGRTDGIRVRIGLNAGEVLESDGEPFGAAINLAARVMDRAGGGQVLATDTVRHLVGTMTGAGFRDRGRIALKGFAERQRLYEIRQVDPLPERPPPRARHGRPGIVAVGVAALGAAAIAAAVLLLAGNGSPAPVSVPANSVAVIDPRSGSVVDALPVDENPGPMAAGAGALWVLNLNSATVSRIDVRTRRLLATLGFGGTPGAGGTPGNVGASATEAWVHAGGCNGDEAGSLLHVSTKREGVGDLAGRDDVALEGAVPPHRTPASTPTGCGLAARGTTAWLGTNGGEEGIARVDYDPATGRSRVTWGRPLRRPPIALALGFGAVWGIDPQQQVVRRFDPATGRTIAQVRVGADPLGIAVDERAVWVADAGDNSVSRIDPRTNVVSQAISVSGGPAAVATGAGAVWVAASENGSVARIDPSTNRVTATIRVGHRPQGVVVAGGLVWVSVRS